MLKSNTPFKHEGVFGSYEQSDVVVFGVPFDGTASYRPGTRFGPSEIRKELDGIETYSPYMDMDMADFYICDLGDMAMRFGDTSRTLEAIKAQAAEFISDGKKTIALGGEHLISFPLISAYARKYPDLNVIHLDAHADLRDSFLGEKLSHATVMRRVHETIGGDIWQFGIRSGTRKEFSFAKANAKTTRFTLDGMAEARKALDGRPVYLSVDIDVLDPSIMPGTGTPEPGGVTFSQLIDGLTGLQGANIVGADLVELSPHYDQSGVSTIAACKILREMILLMV